MNCGLPLQHCYDMVIVLCNSGHLKFNFVADLRYFADTKMRATVTKLIHFLTSSKRGIIPLTLSIAIIPISCKLLTTHIMKKHDVDRPRNISLSTHFRISSMCMHIC